MGNYFSNVSTESWYDIMIKLPKNVVPYGNTPKTRILVLSGTTVDVTGQKTALSDHGLKNDQIFKVDEELLYYTKNLYHMEIEALNLAYYYNKHLDFLTYVRDFAPTCIVMNFSHNSFQTVPVLTHCDKMSGQPLELLDVICHLRSWLMLRRLVYNTSECMIFEMQNIRENPL